MLVDLETAKGDLRMDDDYADEIIFSKIEEASSIVLDYLKLDAEPDPVPFFVRAATLLVIRSLFDGGDPLSDPVVRLLHRYRDPAIA